MNAERLLEYFDRIAEAPDAVPRLRRFIVDLAVRGKLVEQDKTDEPAAALLLDIKSEKMRLLRLGKVAHERPMQPIKEEELPFELPRHWSWARLRDVTSYIQRGKSPQYATEGGSPVISQKCVQWSGLKLEYAKRITLDSLKRYEAVRFLQDGDLLWNSTGTGTIGRVVRVDRPDKQLVCDSHVTVVRCLRVDERFICIWLSSDHVYGSIETRAAGATKQVELTSALAVNQISPVPPLTEQHRIVAKVNELMALCDELEAAQQKRERRRDRLVAATLHGLNNGEDGKDFREHARFYFNHLPRLTTRSEHIQRLRQAILNLAVRGRLVLQDPNDESADALLKRIERERTRLLKAQGLREQKAAEPSEHLEVEAEIPDTWEYSYLQDIAYQITDGTHQTPKYTEGGRPFLSAQNIKPFRFMPENHRYVSERDYENYRANRKPEKGDVLLTRVGAGIGEAAVLDSDIEFAFYVSVCLIKIPTRFFLPEFLVVWLNSPTGRGYSTTRTYGKGFSQGNLNLGLIRTFRVPVPPLAEQHRIVAKVDELMSVCDDLEAALAGSMTMRSRLLEATLHDALSA